MTATGGRRVDWDVIERDYVDHGVEQIGEPITPTRGLDMDDIGDVLAGRPLADKPRTGTAATWRTGVPTDPPADPANGCPSSRLAGTGGIGL